MTFLDKFGTAALRVECNPPLNGHKEVVISKQILCGLKTLWIETLVGNEVDLVIDVVHMNDFDGIYKYLEDQGYKVFIN